MKGRPVVISESEQSATLRRRCGAFLLDYILALTVPAATLVLAVYITRHWPLLRVSQVFMVPGFAAMATGFLYQSIVAQLEAAKVTTPLSVMGYLATAGLIFYNWVYVYAHQRQSFGKQFIGLRVRRLDGAPMDYRTALRRHLIGYPVSLLCLGLGVLSILWDPRQQGWHDKLARTVVEME